VSLDIVYVGTVGGTCEQRARALRSFGHRVRRIVADPPAAGPARLYYRIAARLGYPPDSMAANRAILSALRGAAPHILWIDKGLAIRPATLRRVRELCPRTAIVAYSPDDMMNPHNQSAYYRRSIALYDVHVTTKSYNVQELADLGARDVAFVDNAYDPETHLPLELDEPTRARFRADTSFIGGYERDRAEQMLHLARNGVEVRVWGYQWHRFPERDARLRVENRMLDGLDYARAINATRINLAFLRKINRDLQTTRSIEIPACAAFMLAERTDEHRRLFEEGREAEFFGSTEELLAKSRYYLEHEDERLRIAQAGYRRCIEGRYSNADRLAVVIDAVRRRHLAGGAT